MWGVLGGVFAPSLPAFVAFLPSFLCPDFPGMQHLRMPLQSAFRYRSVLWVCRQEVSFADLGRNSRTLACSAGRAPGRQRRFSLRQLGALPAPSPSRGWTAVPRTAHWYSRCFGRSLMLWDSVPWQSSRGCGRKLQQRAQPAPSDARENKAGAWLQVGMLPVRKFPKPLRANRNTPWSWN